MTNYPDPGVIREQRLSRRRVMQLGLGASLALGGVAHLPSVAVARAVQSEEAPGVGTPTAEGAVKVVGDVLDFRLDPAGRWEGAFGSVTLKLHRAWVDGDEAWFIRTDASDGDFAQEEGLVHVPLLQRALGTPESLATLYLFEVGAEGQTAVLSTVPGRDDFTSAFRVHNVTFSGEPELLDSVEAITAAAQAGVVDVAQTDVVVNYPLVKWPGGGLPVDDELKEYLGTGPLVEEPDTDGGEVTFKLHQCYPGSRYFFTDTSAAPMAPMMGVAVSAPTQLLSEAGATAPIYVFGNGLKGPGAMGFQPAIFNASAGDPVWSPFWDHFTVMWTDESRAELLTTETELKEREAAGDVELFNGTPDTHPDGFVVNCPSPVLAPPDYDPAQFVQGTPAP